MTGNGFTLPAPALISLQWKAVAPWLQLYFSHTFSPSPEQRSGEGASLCTPWAVQQARVTLKPQRSSEGSEKGHELECCTVAHSVELLS